MLANLYSLVMAKMWLLVYHPFHRPGGRVILPQETKDRLFLTSIEVIEYSRLLETETATARWGWLFRTYVQWQTVAIMLSELCVRNNGPVVDRAWKAVDGSFKDWGETVKPKNAMLWRPLKKLYQKARLHREQQLRTSESMHGTLPIESQAESNYPVSNVENNAPFTNFGANTIDSTMRELQMPLSANSSAAVNQSNGLDPLNSLRDSVEQSSSALPQSLGQQPLPVYEMLQLPQYNTDPLIPPIPTADVSTGVPPWMVDSSLLMDLGGNEGQPAGWDDWDEIAKDYQLNGNWIPPSERESSW